MSDKVIVTEPCDVKGAGSRSCSVQAVLITRNMESGAVWVNSSNMVNFSSFEPSHCSRVAPLHGSDVLSLEAQSSGKMHRTGPSFTRQGKGESVQLGVPRPGLACQKRTLFVFSQLEVVFSLSWESDPHD